MTQIIETQNLLLRLPEKHDAPMILSLFNQQDFIRFIGDKELASIADAEKYIEEKFIGSYQEHGFCLYTIELKQTAAAVGLCGLVKREELDDVDIGFAMLSVYQGQGILSEAAQATRDYAINNLGITRLLGITNSDNLASAHILEKIGLRFEKMIRLKPEEKEIKLFALNV